MTNSSEVIINGKSVIFECAVNCMDDGLMETIWSECDADISNQEFADKYCAMHAAQFGGETFEVS